MATPHLQLGERFGDAVTYAAGLHGMQVRKDTTIPYVSHLLGAAAFVIEQPGSSEDEAIAALLHDALEDQPDGTSLEEITDRFGPAVAQIVLDCTDAHEHPKPPWRHRKADYLLHLEQVTEPSLRVSLADKLHNARAIETDLAQHGPLLWSRFNAPPVAQRWYYTALAEVFTRRLGNEVSAALATTVARITEHLPATLQLPAGITDRPGWVGADALTGAAASISDAGRSVTGDAGDLVPTGPGAWTTTSRRWWVERVDTGNPARPLAIFVSPR